MYINSKKIFTMNFTIMKKLFAKILLIVCLIFLIICFLLIPDVSISNLSSSTQVTDDDRYLDIYKNGFGDLNMIDFARFFSKLFLMIETKKIDYRQVTFKFQIKKIKLFQFNRFSVIEESHSKSSKKDPHTRLVFACSFHTFIFIFSNVEFRINISHQVVDTLSWSLPHL